jgi:hypothetical protein
MIVPERESFEKNIKYVNQYLIGNGIDMGCGRCFLNKPNCIHVDLQGQDYIENAMGEPFPEGQKYFQARADLPLSIKLDGVEQRFDFVFSSHMVEDLATKEDIINCLVNWSDRLLKSKGHIVLLLPDMLGGRYPTVAQGGNPSHRVDMGIGFFKEIEETLKEKGLMIIQLSTIPYELGCTFDVVLQKIS